MLQSWEITFLGATDAAACCWSSTISCRGILGTLKVISQYYVGPVLNMWYPLYYRVPVARMNFGLHMSTSYQHNFSLTSPFILRKSSVCDWLSFSFLSKTSSLLQCTFTTQLTHAVSTIALALTDYSSSLHLNTFPVTLQYLYQKASSGYCSWFFWHTRPVMTHDCHSHPHCSPGPFSNSVTMQQLPPTAISVEFQNVQNTPYLPGCYI